MISMIMKGWVWVVSEENVQVLTIENVREVVESVFDSRLNTLVTKTEFQSMYDRLEGFASKTELAALRDDFEHRMNEKEKQLHSIRDFVQEHTLKMENQSKRIEAVLDRLDTKISTNRELEDARDASVKQLVKQVDANTNGLVVVQELASSNSQGLRRTEGELGDVLVRMIPLTHEVMGNKETGKISLRQEWQTQNHTILDKLNGIHNGVARITERVDVIENDMQETKRRHREEDKWLRERPRKIRNAVVQIGAELFASSAIKWLAIILGGTGLGAAAIELLRVIFGG